MPTSSLWDTGTRIGRLAWFARQLAALTGGWARDDRTPGLARVLGTMSNHHAVLAARCEARLPTVALTDGTTRQPGDFVTHTLADEQAVCGHADASEVDDRCRALRHVVESAHELAAMARADVDAVLDEPSATLLDDVLARLDADLAVLTGHRVPS